MTKPAGVLHTMNIGELLNDQESPHGRPPVMRAFTVLSHSLVTLATRIYSLVTPATRIYSLVTPVTRIYSLVTPATRIYSLVTPATRIYSLVTPATRIYSLVTLATRTSPARPLSPAPNGGRMRLATIRRGLHRRQKDPWGC